MTIPASPPYLSIILPAWNGASLLEKSLEAIRKSSFRDYELVVVDDASTDEAGEVIARFRPDVVLRNPRSLDADASRNLGAGRARGEVLVFMDQDVVLPPDALARTAHWFRSLGAGCVIGVYSLSHPNPDLCSRYKNAWIRYTYLRRFPRPNWFWTGYGAVLRERFLALGGFDTNFNTSHAGGDFDLGFRLLRGGTTIIGDPTLEVIHLKRYNLRSLLANDHRRAYGMLRSARVSGPGLWRSLRGGVGNVPATHGLSVALSWGLVASVLLALALPVPAVLPLSLALLYAALLVPFHCFLARTHSPGFSLQCVPVTFLDHLASGTGVLAALLPSAKGRGAKGASAPEQV